MSDVLACLEEAGVLSMVAFLQWSPTTPGLFSIASFDGTVGICSLQSFVAPQQQGAADVYAAQPGGV